MDYSMPCPECGKKHIYFTHEIGSTGECASCGAKFALLEQPTRDVMRLVWATLAVIVIVIAALLNFTNIIR